MSDADPQCPSCRTPLVRSAGASGLRFQCPSCHGVVIAIAVFRRVLSDGIGVRVWVASAGEPQSGLLCGFCGRVMRPTPVPDAESRLATVEVCRVCEAVWVPADQAALLPVPTSTSLATSAVPDRCPYCGAPYEATPDGSCPYCHRSVVPSQVVIVAGPGDSTDWGAQDVNWGAGAVGAAAGVVLSILLGR